MKNKIVNSWTKTKHRAGSAEDIANAVSLTVVDSFALYQAYQHRHEGYEWLLLLGAASWVTFQAFRAWSKVLDK